MSDDQNKRTFAVFELTQGKRNNAQTEQTQPEPTDHPEGHQNDEGNFHFTPNTVDKSGDEDRGHRIANNGP